MNKENKPLTARQLRGLFWTIELNLLMWLGVTSSIWQSQAKDGVEYIAAAGFIFAALFQHWAYYNIYKRVKESE